MRESDPAKIFCDCGNPSLAQLVDHICNDCEDLYVNCVKCNQKESDERHR